MASSLPSIACKECGHVNEGERLYCHNCGNKLDRSSILSQQQEEGLSPEETRRRLKKMMNPAGTGWSLAGFLKTGTKTILSAALAGALIDIALPPENVPPMPDSVDDSPRIALESLAIASPGRQITLKEEAINAYLKGNVRVKKGEGMRAQALKFQRAFVNLNEGTLRITSQSALYDYSLYAGVEYRLGVANKELTVTPLGGNLGRLHLPAAAARYAGVVFNPLWSCLKSEKELMEKLGGLEIQPGAMILSSPGTPSAPAADTAAPPAQPAAAIQPDASAAASPSP